MAPPPLARWVGTWRGTWTLHHLDGVDASDAVLVVEGDRLRYRWSHEGAQEGHLLVEAGEGRKITATWADSWLGEPSLTLDGAVRPTGLELEGQYAATGEIWTWRIVLKEPATLEMIDVSPAGTERTVVRFEGAPDLA